MLKLLVLSFALFGVVNLTDVSFYEILGVSKKATTQEIRQAYKKLAVKFHPDKNTNSEEQDKFLKITEAYETLKDPDKRHKYDLYGSHAYTRKYDYQSQAEYDNLYYNGLYHDDPFVDTLSGGMYYNYLKDGFHFINFYSPFCPPCQNVADHWKKLAEIYKGIVKVGAVNCKYHNSFCYNNMRIGSYPSLLFYPNGKNGNYMYYRGERTLEALDDFLATYLRSQVHVPTVTQIRSTDRPMVYVMGANRIERNTLTRIAYHLNGIATVAIVEDDDLRKKLVRDEYTAIVIKYKKIAQEIESTEEGEILREIEDALPKIESVTPDKLKAIRNKLRNGGRTPWVFHFSAKGENSLLLHQMIIAFPNINFGTIDCERWGELCSSLHVASPPGWGVLKPGGAYQSAPAHARIVDFIASAHTALRLHTLSASDLQRILDGVDVGIWVLLLAPHESSWEHIAEPFARTTQHFVRDEHINFGIMSCTPATDKYCRKLSHKPAVIVQHGTKRHYYTGREYDQQLIQFIELLRDSGDLELTEQQVLEILDASGREQAWLVAFLPRHCASCDLLAHEWMLLARKLRPLEFVRVGLFNCARQSSTFCQNIQSPVARLYPIASGQHYSVNLQHLSQAPYMLEWALNYIDDSVIKLTWNTFTKSVIAEELNPTSGKKPWLAYFHSPRCYRCYEMYADFAIAGILLNNAVQLGRVNCVNERSLCQHEQVMSYPTLKLYLNRNQRQTFSTVVNIQLRDYDAMMEEIKGHLAKYDKNLLAGLNVRKGFDIKHDEF